MTTVGRSAPSEELRCRVWEERIAAHTRSIYFNRLAFRYRRAERCLGLFTALFSSATLTATLGGLGIGPLWPAVVACVSGILVGLLKYGEAFVALKNSALAWGELHDRLDDLWVEMEKGEADHRSVHEELARIRENGRHIDRETVGQRERPRLLRKALDQAEGLA